MLSYHNYDGTPPPESMLRRMLRIPADGYKIVTTARKPSDNSRILALTKSHPRTPLMVLAMGETGFPTRVLSTAWGGMFTYAAPNASEGTAAGQVSARVLRHLYRVEKFSRAAKIYGVIADPVRHSISPAVHNRAFQARRVDAVYLPFLVQPAQLKDFFMLAESLPLAGFSVTIPHKQKILRYLDVVDPLARRIGAVNTVWRKAGKWRGANTDADGVTVPLSRKLRLAKSLRAGGRQRRRGAQRGVCAGGSGAQSLHRRAAIPTACVARQGLRRRVPAARTAERPQVRRAWSTPRRSACSRIPTRASFPAPFPAKLVFDMVYNPLETTLLRHAARRARRSSPGSRCFSNKPPGNSRSGPATRPALGDGEGRHRSPGAGC